MPTYSEKDLESIKLKRAEAADKVSLYEHMGKGMFHATYSFAVVSVIYAALTAYYGTEYLSGVWVFGGTFLVGVMITVTLSKIAHKWHRRVLMCETYINKHTYDFNLNPRKEN